MGIACEEDSNSTPSPQPSSRQTSKERARTKSKSPVGSRSASVSPGGRQHSPLIANPTSPKLNATSINVGEGDGQNFSKMEMQFLNFENQPQPFANPNIKILFNGLNNNSQNLKSTLEFKPEPFPNAEVQDVNSPVKGRLSGNRVRGFDVESLLKPEETSKQPESFDLSSKLSSSFSSLPALGKVDLPDCSDCKIQVLSNSPQTPINQFAQNDSVPTNTNSLTAAYFQYLLQLNAIYQNHLQNFEISPSNGLGIPPAQLNCGQSPNRY